MNGIVHNPPQNGSIEYSWPLISNSLNRQNVKDKLLLSSLQKSDASSKIEQVNLSFCDLLKVPSQICELKFLKVLNLSNNEISFLPPEIEDLSNLTSLNLSNNKLNSLPKFFKQINQLIYLNLSHNEFFEVPDVLSFALQNIKVLDLSFNKISSFVERPYCFNNLVHLQLTNNLLKTLPKWLFDGLCHVQILDLSENNIHFEWSHFVSYHNSGIFVSVKILNMGYCNVNYQSLQFFSNFKKLEVLHLGNKKNSFTKNSFPELDLSLFEGCASLRHLILDNTQISYLSGNFSNTLHVEFLNLSGNFLSWLPDAFCNLSHLLGLDLSSNQLLFLPNDIFKLNQLKYINLANNCLFELPESFCKLNSLEFVDLYNNKIRKLDHKVFKMKSLRGIDLGMNCLDFNCVSGDELIREYNKLKEKFRDKFGCCERLDVQSFDFEEDINNEDNYSSFSNNSWNLENKNLSSDDEGIITNENNTQTSFEEENWEEEIVCKPDEDEEFDPNAVKYRFKDVPKNFVETLEKTKFQNKFCPADLHVCSLLQTFKRKVLTVFKHETVEEGQFDSD